jgi:hypothetical protein
MTFQLAFTSALEIAMLAMKLKFVFYLDLDLLRLVSHIPVPDGRHSVGKVLVAFFTTEAVVERMCSGCMTIGI